MNTKINSERGQAAVSFLVFILLLFIAVAGIMLAWDVIFSTVQCSGPLCQSAISAHASNVMAIELRHNACHTYHTFKHQKADDKFNELDGVQCGKGDNAVEPTNENEHTTTEQPIIYHDPQPTEDTHIVIDDPKPETVVTIDDPQPEQEVTTDNSDTENDTESNDDNEVSDNEHTDNGNHYGNDKPDNNSNDVNNPHNGEQTAADHHDNNGNSDHTNGNGANH